MVKMAWKKINLKFTLLVIIKIFFVSEVFSKDKFIDGIKLRYTQPNTKIDIKYKSGSEGKDFLNSHGGSTAAVKHLYDKQNKPLFPVNIVFPETLMNSFSFRGAFIEFNQQLNVENMAPTGEVNDGYLRQENSVREFLKNDFFNDDELNFINNNDRWALSGDIDFTTTVIGYYWGLFIPIFEHNRIFKIGLGPAVGYSESKIELYLCGEYRVSDAEEPNCTQKMFVDKALSARPFLTFVFSVNLYQRFTESSIFSLLTYTGSTAGTQNIQYEFENHDGSQIFENSQVGQFEIISYTYRF